MRRAALGVMAMVVCGGWTVMARADAPLPIRITIVSPELCPQTSASFFALMRGRTSRARLATSTETATEFLARTERFESQIRGLLEVREPDGSSRSRTVLGNTCEEVTGALALVAALVVDPRALTADPEPPPPPPPPGPKPSVARQVPKATTLPPPADPWAIGLGASLAVIGGMGPGAAWAPAGYAQVGSETGLLRVTVARPRDRETSTSAGLVRYEGLTSRFEPCVRAWHMEGAWMRACGWMSVTSMTSLQLATGGEDTKRWSNFGLSGRGGLSLHRSLVLEAALGAGGTTMAQKFEGGYQIPHWMAFAELSVGLLFP